MKNLKEELIAYQTYYDNEPERHNNMSIIDNVNEYLEAIKSEAPDETPNVNNNEAQEKDCDNCYFKDEPNYMNPCLCCVNHDNWTQSD